MNINCLHCEKHCDEKRAEEIPVPQFFAFFLDGEGEEGVAQLDEDAAEILFEGGADGLLEVLVGLEEVLVDEDCVFILWFRHSCLLFL